MEKTIRDIYFELVNGNSQVRFFDVETNETPKVMNITPGSSDPELFIKFITIPCAAEMMDVDVRDYKMFYLPMFERLVTWLNAANEAA